MVWLLVAVLVAIDQGSKWLIRVNLPEGGLFELIPGFLRVFHVTNKGAAWSFLADRHWGIYLLTALSLIVTVLILFLLTRTRSFAARICLILIAGGSIGNLIDRVRLGGVTDFISLLFGTYAFPVFNVADICITCGAGLLILFALRRPALIDELLPLKLKPPAGEEKL